VSTTSVITIAMEAAMQGAPGDFRVLHVVERERLGMGRAVLGECVDARMRKRIAEHGMNEHRKEKKS